MNKKLFVLILVVVSALALSACQAETVDEYSKACFDLGGRLGPNGCEIPPCPTCPVCETVVQPEKPAEIAPAPGGVDTSWCQAEVIGTPVEKEGECAFCTINYLYDPKGINPGDVYIVSSESMKYEIGAYVYQYKEDKFLGCIAAQPFMTDPGYRPVYK